MHIYLYFWKLLSDVYMLIKIPIKYQELSSKRNT